MKPMKCDICNKREGKNTKFTMGGSANICDECRFSPIGMIVPFLIAGAVLLVFLFV